MPISEIDKKKKSGITILMDNGSAKVGDVEKRGRARSLLIKNFTRSLARGRSCN